MRYQLPHVSIVVIGYNEADNLDRTFQSITNMNYDIDRIEITYVDSGSNDESINIAHKYTDKVFIEDQFPTPGRNRNRGLIESSHDIVHFLDGDIEIDQNYLRNIVDLFSQKGVIAIVGQLKELDSSLFNRLATWANAPKVEGYTMFTSAGGTYLRDPLISLNGYDERISRGEESELGFRLRKQGYKIWCTQEVLGVHNYGIGGIRAYVKRDMANGIALVKRALIHGESEYFIAARKIYMKQLGQLTVISVAAISVAIWNKLFILFLFIVLLCAIWENRRYYHHLSREPKLLLVKILLSIPGRLLWWIGVIGETWRYLFSPSQREFYSLTKSQLSKLVDTQNFAKKS